MAEISVNEHERLIDELEKELSVFMDKRDKDRPPAVLSYGVWETRVEALIDLHFNGYANVGGSALDGKAEDQYFLENATFGTSGILYRKEFGWEFQANGTNHSGQACCYTC